MRTLLCIAVDASSASSASFSCVETVPVAAAAWGTLWMIRHRLFADDIFFHILHGAPGAWQHAGAWQQTYAQCLLKSWGLFQVLATSRMFTGSFSSSGPDFHLSLFFSLSFFPILLFLGKLYKLMWQNEHTHTHTNAHLGKAHCEVWLPLWRQQVCKWIINIIYFSKYILQIKSENSIQSHN